METTITESTKVLYTAKTHTTGGREHGVSRSSDGRLDIKSYRRIQYPRGRGVDATDGWKATGRPPKSSETTCRYYIRKKSTVTSHFGIRCISDKSREGKSRRRRSRKMESPDVLY